MGIQSNSSINNYNAYNSPPKASMINVKPADNIEQIPDLPMVRHTSTDMNNEGIASITGDTAPFTQGYLEDNNNNDDIKIIPNPGGITKGTPKPNDNGNGKDDDEDLYEPGNV